MSGRALEAVPLAHGAPLIGHTLSWLRRPIHTPVAAHRRHGDVFRYPIFFDQPVVFAHPDAIGTLLTDPDRALSTADGWRPFFGRMMRGGLLLRDHDDHREHRARLRRAFTPTALAGYAEAMRPHIDARVAEWAAATTLHALPAVQRLLLELAARTLVGVDASADIDRLIQAFEALARGVMAIVRAPLPGTALRRGLKARATLEAFVQERIAARRAAPRADLISHLCTGEDALPDDAIVDHVIFLWMAAHDTTTSALVTTLLELARHPAWQERLRDGARARPAHLTPEGMREAAEVEWVFSEAMRLYPPVGSIPRRARADTTVAGVHLPAGTPVRAAILLAHRHPAFWTAPERFDPERFGDRAEHRRHRFQYRPFGAGAHACLGRVMAHHQLHLLLHAVLRRLRFRLPPGAGARFTPTPSLRPADGLPLQVEPIR